MATVSTEIDFDITASYSAKEFSLSDASTYLATDLIWASGVSRGILKVVDPQGNTIYNNTDTTSPDLTSGGGTISGIKFASDADGNLITGKYQVTLTLFDVSVPATQFERTFTMGVTFIEPTTVLDTSWSIINPIYFKNVDNTNYDQYQYAYTISRTQTLYNPPTVGGSVSQTGKTFNTSSFYTTTSTIELAVDVDYELIGFFNDTPNTDIAFTFNYTKTTREEVYIDGTSSVCQMYCCVKKAWDNYQTARVNMTSSEGLKHQIWADASDNWFMMKQAFECNQSQDVAGFRSEIQRITKCSGANCDCSSVTPEQVIGIGTTNEITKKLTYTASSNITSYTESELKGLSWVDGDFLAFVDGQEVESTNGTSGFNSATGEFTFGFTVFTGVEFYFQIIKR